MIEYTRGSLEEFETTYVFSCLRPGFTNHETSYRVLTIQAIQTRAFSPY